MVLQKPNSEKIKMDNQNLEERAEIRWYDTVEGILGASTSLESFNKLVNERRKAGYERKEHLNEFKVLDGKYNLDACGNAWKRINESTFSIESDIPLPNLECKYCGEGWDIENIDDTVVRQNRQTILLADFVGKTLGDVKKQYSDKTDAIYRMQPSILIRNDVNIDLSPKYPGTDKDWQKGMVKNEMGWLGESEGITDNSIIQEGDEGFFNVWTYFHKSCNRKDLRESYRKKFRQIFEDTGFKDVRVSATDNQYCGCDHCAPWYEVGTEHGTFLIGWRKRVINIDWSGIDVEGADKLFKSEDVTKGSTYIHAWGEDKAKDYLTRIHNALE